MTESEFRQWLKTAKPRERFAYHEGHLRVDRKRSAELDALADRIYMAAKKRWVLLTQERNDDGTFLYFVTRASYHFITPAVKAA